jgi:hypothetical protein
MSKTVNVMGPECYIEGLVKTHRFLIASKERFGEGDWNVTLTDEKAVDKFVDACDVLDVRAVLV